jgi:hypothetical protein
VDKFITADGSAGRMVDVITRGEPALMLAHWTGIYFNGQETGFKILQEVKKRLHARFDNLHWMKLSEVARYWAAKELTSIVRAGDELKFKAPYACEEFTVRWQDIGGRAGAITLRAGADATKLEEVTGPLKLVPGTWCRDGRDVMACFSLPKGESVIVQR